MLPCREVIQWLWDYLDGELPPESMARVAEHLAECGRCYPQYRFDFAFLQVLARQRARLPEPPQTLVERLRLLIST